MIRYSLVLATVWLRVRAPIYFWFCEARDTKQPLKLICDETTTSVEGGKGNGSDQLTKSFVDKPGPQTMPQPGRSYTAVFSTSLLINIRTHVGNA